MKHSLRRNQYTADSGADAGEIIAEADKNLPEYWIDAGQFNQRLLAWYQLSKRSLPWREHAHDPYAVWISEIMLQQTTVPAVIGFFNRWMERFPTVASLAESSMDEVLCYWAGLGYYSRARNIHKAARVIVEHHSGQLPSSTPELTSLPGIGRYTAGAISSIAFGEQEAVVDVNVRRILARIFGLGSEASDKKLWKIAQSLMPKEHPGLYNQALMDLGASICSPKSPRCEICPVFELCTAGKSENPEQFGTRPKAKVWRAVNHVSVAVLSNSKVLLQQRPMDSPLWPGLWELPRRVVLQGECEGLVAGQILTDLGLVREGELNKFTSLSHVVTNNKIKLACYIAIIDGLCDDIPMQDSGFRWVTKSDISALALSAPQKSLIAKLADTGLI